MILENKALMAKQIMLNTDEEQMGLEFRTV